MPQENINNLQVLFCCYFQRINCTAELRIRTELSEQGYANMGVLQSALLDD